MSKALKDVEQRYSEIERAALALVLTARRLRPYFMAHKVVVRTNYPLKQTLGKSEVAGRMVKWAVEMSSFDIDFEPRMAIKAQALAEFLFEGVRTEDEEKGDGVWLLHTDRSATNNGSAAGIVIRTPQGEELEYAVTFQFKASNNEAEYEALIIGLKMARKAGARRLIVHCDSQLVVQ